MFTFPLALAEIFSYIEGTEGENNMTINEIKIGDKVKLIGHAPVCEVVKITPMTDWCPSDRITIRVVGGKRGTVARPADLIKV